jgi:hypothetical protein
MVGGSAFCPAPHLLLLHSLPLQTKERAFLKNGERSPEHIAV